MSISNERCRKLSEHALRALKIARNNPTKRKSHPLLRKLVPI